MAISQAPKCGGCGGMMSLVADQVGTGYRCWKCNPAPQTQPVPPEPSPFMSNEVRFASIEKAIELHSRCAAIERRAGEVRERLLLVEMKLGKLHDSLFDGSVPAADLKAGTAKIQQHWGGVAAEGSADSWKVLCEDAVKREIQAEKERDAISEKFRYYTRNAPAWISVKKRLPELKTPSVVVLVAALDNENRPWVTEAYFMNGLAKCEFHPTKYMSAPLNVTHWMPLPEPPKEGA